MELWLRFYGFKRKFVHVHRRTHTHELNLMNSQEEVVGVIAYLANALWGFPFIW